MSTIDSVTKSFATSIAIASNEVVDISRMSEGGARRNSQSYLLARPLAMKATSAVDLQRHFRRIWILKQGFSVQQRAPDRFLFSFDLKGDRNKVLMGGPWSFGRAMVVVQPYDGVAPMQAVPMRDLLCWVRISNMPPAYEEKETIVDVASVVGNFLDLDRKLFDTMREIRVRVSHPISKPFFKEKTLKFAQDVEQEVHFFFEKLVGLCNTCGRVFHEGGTCDVVSPPLTKKKAVENQVDRKLDLTGSFLGLNPNQFKDGTFHFQGITTPILPLVGRTLFGGPESSKSRRPVVIRSVDAKQVCEDNALALVPVETDPCSKRVRSFPSPKKLKFLMSDLLEGKTSPIAPAKKVKLPEFPTKFSAKSLGLVETPGGMLVPSEVMQPRPAIEFSVAKKKKGRPLGSKNKNPKSKKVFAEEVLTVLYSGKPPSPTLKGKEKI